VHNLTKTIAAVSLLAPMTAHSLGVGGLKLHSALNQKLDAEISLSLSAGEELADVKISLASPDKFDQAGIAWNYFLSKIKFEPTLKSNGQVIVKVTSNEMVQEPFLDFLLEVSWPKGEVFKEFTVLVDPPAVYQQNIVETSAVKDSITKVSAVSTKKNDFNSLAVEGEYGPTNRNDSLWKVAEKVNPDSNISVEQMMMALYKANPRAFYKKNVNALMAGKTLKIPEKSDILQLSKKQANTQFYHQMAVWEGKAAPEPEQQMVSSDPETNNQLTLVPPSEEVISSEALSANVTNELDTSSLSLNDENQALQERLANLEKQFVIMKDMLAIKDQQLAAIQNSQSASIAPSETTPNINEDSVVAENSVQAIKEPQEAEAISQPVTTPVAVEKEVVTQEVEIRSAPVVSAPVVKDPVVNVVKEPQDSGINYSYISAGFFGGLALLGVAFVLWRRRQDEDEIEENSMFASSSEIILPEVEVEDEDELAVPVFDETPSYDVGTVGESSFLSEFTPSDFDVFESDQAEIDPTSETDVYLAYGRYQQAEELMRQAIQDYPDRDDYKLKLLEIFYASENGEAFEVYAQELADNGKKDELNFWAKISEMGGELIPSSALFSAGQEAKFDVDDAPSTRAEQKPVSPDTEESELTVDFDEPAIESPADTESSDNSGIDFDLSSFSLTDDDEVEVEASQQESKELGGGIESVDFDLSSFGTVASDLEGTSGLGIKEDLESFDFDLTGASESDEPLVLNEEIDDVNLSDFDFSADSASKDSDEASISDPEDTLENEADSSGFDFDFDDVSMPTTEKSDVADEPELIVSDLTDMDEFETKIDLVKAYIDMGDSVAAKEIAQEVLDKGSDAQKQEVQAIIDKLD